MCQIKDEKQEDYIKTKLIVHYNLMIYEMWVVILPPILTLIQVYI